MTMNRLWVVCALLLLTSACAATSNALDPTEPLVDETVIEQAQRAYTDENWPLTAELYQKLVRTQPESARNWYRLAVAERYVGNLDEALNALEQGQAVGLPIRFADYERAKVAATRGDGQQAITYLRAAANAGLSGAQRVHENPQLSRLTDVAGFDDVVDQLDANANPCRDEVYHQFDFWIGDWQVTDASGTVAGRNRISARDSSCLLLEEWTSAGGNTGTSMNYYDAKREQWTQVWVSPGLQLHITGGLQDGSMVMTGDAYFPQQGTTSAFRGTWTPLEDGRVRQFFEQHDATGAWQPWFEGFYQRVESGQ